MHDVLIDGESTTLPVMLTSELVFVAAAIRVALVFT